MKTKIADIKIGQPAIRALQSIGIEYLEQLSDYNEKDLLALHGFGKKGLLILQNAMALKGLAFKAKGESHV